MLERGSSQQKSLHFCGELSARSRGAMALTVSSGPLVSGVGSRAKWPIPVPVSVFLQELMLPA